MRKPFDMRSWVFTPSVDNRTHQPCRPYPPWPIVEPHPQYAAQPPAPYPTTHSTSSLPPQILLRFWEGSTRSRRWDINLSRPFPVRLYSLCRPRPRPQSWSKPVQDQHRFYHITAGNQIEIHKGTTFKGFFRVIFSIDLPICSPTPWKDR